jgi:hypothetical protein
MSKAFKQLIIHCTATHEGADIQPETIKRWHTAPAPQGRGWKVVGYSDLILLNGARHKFVEHNGDLFIQPGEITNGVAGQNSISRHVCYVGGVEKTTSKRKNTLTAAQAETLKQIIFEVLKYAPNVVIAGHNQFNNKACPSFWVPTFLRSIGVEEKNIYTKDPFGYGKLF